MPTPKPSPHAKVCDVSSPTVIERFLGEVTSALRARGANGAAEHTWRAGAIFEPRGRADRVDAEQRRLLLLADRAARVWASTTVATLRDDRLEELARQQPQIRSPHDAQAAARHIGALRDLAGRLPKAPRPGTADGVASALAPLQLMIRQVADGDPNRPDLTAAAAVPHAARGLVACFFEGAGFGDGIPGEVRTTIAVLDSLDERRVLSWGAPARERSAHESDLHRTLVRSLMSTLALRVGEITHADDGGTLPSPPTIGRHRPDLVGRTATGDPFLGEAKLGPELFDPHAQEQLADFLGCAVDEESIVLHLIVPQGWRAEAERAGHAAAGSIANLVVHELGGLPGAPQPR